MPHFLPAIVETAFHVLDNSDFCPETVCFAYATEMKIKLDILKFWNFKELCSLTFTCKKETKQILAAIPQSSFLFSKKSKKTWLQVFLFIFFQLYSHSQNSKSGSSRSCTQNDSLPRCIYFSGLPLYKGKKTHFQDIFGNVWLSSKIKTRKLITTWHFNPINSNQHKSILIKTCKSWGYQRDGPLLQGDASNRYIPYKWRGCKSLKEAKIKLY